MVAATYRGQSNAWFILSQVRRQCEPEGLWNGEQPPANQTERGSLRPVLRSFAKLGKEGRGDEDPDAVALGVPPAPASCPPNHDCFMRFFFPLVRKMGCGVNYWEKIYKVLMANLFF